MFPKADAIQAIIAIVVCVVLMGIYVWWQVERSIRLLSMHISDAFGLGTTLVLVWK